MNQSEEEQLFNDLSKVLNGAFRSGAFDLQTAPLAISVFERSAKSLQELVEFKEQEPEEESDIFEKEAPETNEIEVPGTKNKVLKTK